MYPGPGGWHKAIELTDNIPDRLQRAFTSTVESFNAKNYYATAVGCRRTLEGIFKYRLPAENQGNNLHNLIEQVRSSQDLAEPLNKLSHAIREGGNLGAHFDEELEPDHELARHMVELLEYFISYLYILPQKIADLDEVLNPPEGTLE